MKKNNELKLFKAIVESELLITSNKNIDNLNFHVDNVYLLNRNIKQFYRLLRFVKQHDTSLFYFWLENKYLLNLYKYVLGDKLLNTKSKTVLFDTNLALLNNKNACSTAVLVGNPNFNQKYVVDKLKLNKILLTTKISLTKNKTDSGIYNVTSEINSLKNVCFYLIVLKEAFSESKKF